MQNHRNKLREREREKIKEYLKGKALQTNRRCSADDKVSPSSHLTKKRKNSPGPL